MEDIQTNSIFDFNFDEESKATLATIAQWATINAIVGFAAIGISVIGFFVTLAKVSSYGGNMSMAMPGLFVVFIVLVIGLLLNITLINASINIKKGLELTDQQHFSTGLGKLASYFKIFGILIICSLVLLVFFVLLTLLFSSGRAF